MVIPPIFIAVPTHICKRYCAEEFVHAIAKYAPSAIAYIVCNSGGDAKDFYLPAIKTVGRIAGKIEYLHRPIRNNGMPNSVHIRVVETMQYLRSLFLSMSNIEYFLSLESDVILNQDTIPSLLKHFESKAVNVVHTNCYPGFNTSQELSFTERITLGCTMFRRKVIERIPFRYDPMILNCFHDALMAIDCIASGIPMLYDPAIVVEHRHKATGDRGWEELPASERN